MKILRKLYAFFFAVEDGSRTIAIPSEESYNECQGTATSALRQALQVYSGQDVEFDYSSANYQLGSSHLASSWIHLPHSIEDVYHVIVNIDIWYTFGRNEGKVPRRCHAEMALEWYGLRWYIARGNIRLCNNPDTYLFSSWFLSGGGEVIVTAKYDGFRQGGIPRWIGMDHRFRSFMPL